MSRKEKPTIDDTVLKELDGYVSARDQVEGVHRDYPQAERDFQRGAEVRNYFGEPVLFGQAPLIAAARSRLAEKQDEVEKYNTQEFYEAAMEKAKLGKEEERDVVFDLARKGLVDLKGLDEKEAKEIKKIAMLSAFVGTLERSIQGVQKAAEQGDMERASNYARELRGIIKQTLNSDVYRLADFNASHAYGQRDPLDYVGPAAKILEVQKAGLIELYGKRAKAFNDAVVRGVVKSKAYVDGATTYLGKAKEVADKKAKSKK